MSNALATIQSAPLLLDQAKIDLLRKTIANDAPDLEFELFVNVCNRTGLDPFAKQIYFIERGNKWQWQTSIDGYRLIADRTKVYAGSDPPVYTEKDGKPDTATVTVWKFVQQQRCAFSATARWAEYNVPNGNLWKKMPYLMLGKCAEALALRKAFPAELSGLYTQEEMGQDDHEMPDQTRAMRRLHAVAKERGVDHEGLHNRAVQDYNVGSMAELSTEQLVDIEGQIVDADTGEVVDTSEAEGVERTDERRAALPKIEQEYYDSICAAKSLDELVSIGNKLRDTGHSNQTLRDAYQDRLTAFRGKPAQRELVGAAAGAAGDDSHTR